jgi:anhydro-N-acetylmuramic acid kinase
MKVVGLISGTSADGIDAALMDIGGVPPELSLRLLRYETYSYPRRLRERLFRLTTDGSVAELCHLNFYIGELFATAAVKVASREGLDVSDLDLIGSHGQTAYHNARPRKEGPGRLRSTLQIGEPSVIAQRTGVTTVADFRPRDIAAGGHGAPLTPDFHYLLFRHPSRSRLIVNIGGISNLTYVPAGKGPESVVAFDTGPGNMLIDGVVNRTSGGRVRMDRGGRIARRGKIHERLLAEWLRDPYFRLKPPKTTGREAFGSARLAGVIKRGRTLGISSRDLLATVTLFTARSIGLSYSRFIGSAAAVDEVIVGGGGTKNATLMRDLSAEFDPVPVLRFEDFGLDSKAVEAMAFAVLAYETVLGVPNNIPSATGADGPAVLGKIIPGRPGIVFPI